MKDIKKKYEDAVNDYIEIFSKKQNLTLDSWVLDDVGTQAFFGDYFFDFIDIKKDIDLKAKKHKIIDWHDYITDVIIKNNKIKSRNQYINYQTYLKL